MTNKELEILEGILIFLEDNKYDKATDLNDIIIKYKEKKKDLSQRQIKRNKTTRRDYNNIMNCLKYAKITNNKENIKKYEELLKKVVFKQ